MEFLDQQTLLLTGVALLAAIVLVFGLMTRGNARLVRELRGRLQSSDAELHELRPLREEAAVLRADVNRLRESEDENRKLSAQLGEREAALSAIKAEKAKTEEYLSTMKGDLDRLKTELEKVRFDCTEAKIERERVETTLLQERTAHTEKVAELGNVRAQIEKDLKILSDSLMKENSEAFMKRAADYFESHKEQSHTGLKTLVNPLNEVLKSYQEKLTEMEQNRKRDEGQIVEQLRSVAETHGRLHDTTSNLVNALRSAPKTRGRWGEQQLRSVLEMAGMLEHVDFVTEHTVEGEEGRQRPDVVLRLPGDRQIVVDAKTPMKAYLDAVEATDDAERDRGLREHAAQMRKHAMQLGSKKYWDVLPKAVDFVVMFVPGDNFYAAAIEQDKDLFEDAYGKQVVIATPTTLLALAKSIAFGWRQEKVSQDAQKIVTLGNELYKRMIKMGDHLGAMSRALHSTVDKHNRFVGSLESSVLPQARKFQELGIGQNLSEIGEASPIELDVRDAQAGRDLEFDGAHEAPAALEGPEESVDEAPADDRETGQAEASAGGGTDEEAAEDEQTLFELEAPEGSEEPSKGAEPASVDEPSGAEVAAEYAEDEDAELRALEAEIAALERAEQEERDRAAKANGSGDDSHKADADNPFKDLAKDLDNPSQQNGNGTVVEIPKSDASAPGGDSAPDHGVRSQATAGSSHH